MNPFFASTARRQALLDEARSWVGTPFFANSSAKGRGVSCQKLAASIYQSTGFLPPEETIPDAPMSRARFAEDSLVEAWLNGRTDFELLPHGSALMPGDLMTFRLKRSVHHVGILVLPGIFVHAAEGVGAQLSPVADSTWMSRLAGVWRPIE